MIELTPLVLVPEFLILNLNPKKDAVDFDE